MGKKNYILPNWKKTNKFNLIDQDSDTVIPEESTADFINTFFTEVGPKLAEKIPARAEINKLYDVPKSFMPEIVVTEEEVRKCVDHINIYKPSSVPTYLQGC